MYLNFKKTKRKSYSKISNYPEYWGFFFVYSVQKTLMARPDSIITSHDIFHIEIIFQASTIQILMGQSKRVRV